MAMPRYSVLSWQASQPCSVPLPCCTICRAQARCDGDRSAGAGGAGGWAAYHAAAASILGRTHVRQHRPHLVVVIGSCAVAKVAHLGQQVVLVLAGDIGKAVGPAHAIHPMALGANLPGLRGRAVQVVVARRGCETPAGASLANAAMNNRARHHAEAMQRTSGPFRRRGHARYAAQQQNRRHQQQREPRPGEHRTVWAPATGRWCCRTPSMSAPLPSSVNRSTAPRSATRWPGPAGSRQRRSQPPRRERKAGSPLDFVPTAAPGLSPATSRA